MPKKTKVPHIYVIAGEASGDALGASIMKALKEQTGGDIRFSGIGGLQMEEQGFTSLFPMQELSVMGITEVLPKLKHLLKRISETTDNILEKQPNIVLTIDSPDFCFRVIKAVRKRTAERPKFIHCVAPTVWAWRPGRAKKVAEFLDGLLCLFPFEPPYFEKEGLDATFIGHPMLESGVLEADGRRYRDLIGIADSEKIVGVLFGSRAGELGRIGPALCQAATQLWEQEGFFHIVAPTLPHLEQEVFHLLKGFPGPIHITTELEHKRDAFASMNAAMAVSGTVGLELAVAGVPHLIAYKMNPVTWHILKYLAHVDYAHLANIMLDKMVIPEFIQAECKPEQLAIAMQGLLKEGTMRTETLQTIQKKLWGGDQLPSQKAAEVILSHME